MYFQPEKHLKLVPPWPEKDTGQVRRLLGGLPLGPQDPRAGSLPAEGALHTGAEVCGPWRARVGHGGPWLAMVGHVGYKA